MKRLELVFNIVSIFIDGIMLSLAGVIAYFLRYRTENIFPQYPILFNLSMRDFFYNTLFAVPVLLVILALYGLYNLKSTRNFGRVFLKIAAAVSTGLMLFVAVYFFDQTVFPSRLIVLISWGLAIFLVSLGRYAILIAERYFLKRGVGLHKLVLIMDWGKDFNFPEEIARRPALGYKIIKIITVNGDQHLVGELQRMHPKEKIDEILLASAKVTKETNEAILKFTHDHGIRLNYVPDIIEAQQTNLTVGNIANIPIIQLNNTPLEGWGRVVKRLTDIIISLAAIILSSPLLALVAIGIKLDSQGRILFVQERFGQGRSFKFYKFRSMYQNLSVGEKYGGKEADTVRKKLWRANIRPGPFLKIKNDPRVTPFGRFIRRTKLDELPQLFNVLKGNMSLVGPRAHVLDEVNLYREKYKRQFTIKPGITGLTQITQAKIPDLPFEEEIRLDTFYLENWSLTLDFSILLKTVLVILGRPSQHDHDYY